MTERFKSEQPEDPAKWLVDQIQAKYNNIVVQIARNAHLNMIAKKLIEQIKMEDKNKKVEDGIREIEHEFVQQENEIKKAVENIHRIRDELLRKIDEYGGEPDEAILIEPVIVSANTDIDCQSRIIDVSIEVLTHSIKGLIDEVKINYPNLKIGDQLDSL